MPPAVPTPVSAVLGLVPTVLGGVRRLPGKAVQLPVIAVSQALGAADKVRREYVELADRGGQLVARFRGTSFDELEDKVEDLVGKTRLGGAYDKAEDALEDAADKARDLGGKAKGSVSDLRNGAAASASNGSGAASAKDAEADVPEAQQTKGTATPKATQPDMTRIDTAASPDVVALVEQVADEVTAGGATPVPTHAELPLADYDHMTLGSLRGRLRSLSLEQLVVVREYEKAKADRLPVVTMLDNRIAKLANDADVSPDGTPSEAPAPEQLAARKAPVKTGKVGAPATAKTSPAPLHSKVRKT